VFYKASLLKAAADYRMKRGSKNDARP